MSNLAVNLRPGEIRDIPEIVAMIKDLHAHNGYCLAGPDEKQLLEDGFGNCRSFYTIVAEVAQENGRLEVIGTITYALSYKISVGKVAVMSGMFVKPNYRSHGIGKQLYQRALKEVFEDHNCHQMNYNAADDNETSKKFYKKLGATEAYKDLLLAPFMHFRDKPFEKKSNTE